MMCVNGDLRHRNNGVDPADNTVDKGEKKHHSIATFQDKTLVEKIFSSKEEVEAFHAHKILGFSCLISFAYRFSNLGWEKDANFGPNYGTLLFIFHHWLLNVSAFMFEIPQRRIKGGFRIWPEYRIHSLVFASRHLACLLLRCIQQWNGREEPYYLAHLAVVLATHAGADFGSYLQKDPSPTIRGTDYSDPFGKWFASEMQFLATSTCLLGYPRYTFQLVVLAIIQLNSFLMTLRRKNVASHFILTSLYGVMLIAAFWIGVYDDQSVEMLIPVCTFGQLGVILRMGPLRVNKYLLWTCLWVVWNWIRIRETVEIDTNPFWIVAFGVTKFISIGLGLQRRAQEVKGREADFSSSLVQIVLASYAAMLSLIVVQNFVLDY